MKLALGAMLLAGLLLNPARLNAEDSIGGIGISLGTDRQTQDLKVMKVIPASPADKSGLKPGYLLRKVNGVDLKGKSLTDCVALIRGPVGTKMTVEVIDPKAHATNQVELTREKIVVVAAAKARLGDPAAALMIKDWVKGSPVDVKDGKAVYVVEFWATWCGPCRVSIPHLTELQKRVKDKGVIVIGVSDEDLNTVKPFVTKMGDKMDYVVACDDERQTSSGYMDAYGQNGIPTAFIVGKDGRIAWLGHPMGGLDQALDDVLAGKLPK